MQNKIISKAPGRVCLFGDHQDYLGLPIIATTIDKEITIEAIKNNTQEFKIFKKDLDINDSISLNQNTGSDEKDLKNKIIKFREDELHHKDIAYDKGATKKGLYSIMDKIIKTGSKVAINISEKI